MDQYSININVQPECLSISHQQWAELPVEVPLHLHGQWHTTISFEGNLRSSILGMDMLCGIPVRRGHLVPWKSAMLASYAKADSTDFSMLSFPQTIRPTSPAYLNITSHLYPTCPITFFVAYSAPAITVRLGSTSPPGQNIWPLGTCDTFVGFSHPRIFPAQMTVPSLRFCAKADEEVRFYPFRYRHNARTLLPWVHSAGGW